MSLAFLYPGEGSQRAGMAAALVRDPEAVRAALIAQDPSGWADSLQALIAGGASALLVLGPGEALAQGTRALRPDVLATTADARAGLVLPAAA